MFLINIVSAYLIILIKNEKKWKWTLYWIQRLNNGSLSGVRETEILKFVFE